MQRDAPTIRHRRATRPARCTSTRHMAESGAGEWVGRSATLCSADSSSSAERSAEMRADIAGTGQWLAAGQMTGLLAMRASQSALLLRFKRAG